MATSDEHSTTTSESHQQLQRAASAQFRRPSLHLISDAEEARENYSNLCVPLYKAALKGDWRVVKQFIEQDPTLLTTAITKDWATVLHVAARADHVHLMENLVELMDKSDLELQDYKGNTAFCFVAAAGNTRIAKKMWQKSVLLPTIRGGQGMAPIIYAALQGKSEMAGYLFPKTFEIFEERDWIVLFFICIENGIYDLALEMLEKRPQLALDPDGNDGTALHVLARRPSSSGGKQNLVIQLVRNIWKQVLLQDEVNMMKIIREPSHVIFSAAEVGNFEFLVELLSTYPDLMWELDNRNRSIIHIAVLQRHASIFNLIHETGPIKDFIVSSLDNIDKSNLLHFAAKSAPQNQLNQVSGAALQMMLELLWFEEVKKIMKPSFIEMKNSEGKTPRELFTIEHEELLQKAERWMKGTAKSCMVVSTLIATGASSAAFTVPGGNDNNGTPNYLEKPPFLIFAISDVFALVSSSISILIFLSILISRYAEEDFLRTLPLKLVSGLIALFVSIISMMVAFSSAFFVAYSHGVKWVPRFISVLAFVPISLFVLLKLPLWLDIVYATYFGRSLFRPNKHRLY